ncbi:MAG: RDD family protein [Gammaproteobacteria bacterium]|nr:RDD family protein [Gammaproteobacteria bacterium]
MNMQIYLARNNEQAGPYTLEQVNAMLANTQIVLTDLAWHEGMETWLPLGQLTGGKMVYNPSNSAASSTIAPFKTSASITVLSDKLKTNERLANGAIIADVSKRIWASLVDFMILLIVTEIVFNMSMPLAAIHKIQSMGYSQLQTFINESKTGDADHMWTVLTSLIPAQVFLYTLIAVILVTVIQLGLVASHGQTIGKMLFKIRIVDMSTGQKAPLMRSVVIRSILFKYLGYLITNFLLLMIDFVFLFTKNNCTLHDRLAKTIVVDAEPIQLEKPKT